MGQTAFDHFDWLPPFCSKLNVRGDHPPGSQNFPSSMTIQRDQNEPAKPRVISNNFSVLMTKDANEDDSERSTPNTPSSHDVKPVGRGQTSFAAVSFSQATSNDNSQWQTQKKASYQAPKQPSSGDGMYRGSSSTLLSRGRIGPSSAYGAGAQPSSTRQFQSQAAVSGRQPHHGQHSGEHRRSTNLPFIPENTLELHDFPKEMITADLQSFVSQVPGVENHYRLKWQNDTSCWLICESADLAHNVFSTLGALEQPDDARINIRRYDVANVIKVGKPDLGAPL